MANAYQTLHFKMADNAYHFETAAIKRGEVSNCDKKTRYHSIELSSFLF
jgi:hypothetical protein